MNKIFLLPVIAAAGLTSCHEDKGVDLYNPLTDTLTVFINNDKHVLGNDAIVHLKLEPGDYTIKSLLGDSVIVDTTVSIDEYQVSAGAIINPSGEPLYTASEKYGGNSTLINYVRGIFFVEDSVLATLTDTAAMAAYARVQLAEFGITEYSSAFDPPFLVDMYLLVGAIKEYPELVVSKNWDYGLSEDFPDEIEVYSDATTNVFGETRSKVFSKLELIDYYLVNYFFPLSSKQETSDLFFDEGSDYDESEYDESEYDESAYDESESEY